MLIKTVNLTRVFQNGSTRIIAVNRVNLEVEKPSFVTIVGPSGSGKTTLLNLLGLNDKPDNGRIFLDGKDMTETPDDEKRRIRLRRIGFIFQNFNLLPSLTSLENIELPIMLAGKTQKQQRERALQLLELVELKGRANHRPNELSMGEMQRVAIARALANSPRLVIADEPTGELDSETGSGIIRLLHRLCKEQETTVIVATHDEKVEKVSDRVYRIRDGAIIA